MSETSMVKKTYEWKPFTGRPVGRAKSRWKDDVRNNLKKIKLVKWAEQIQDRRKLEDIFEKAKLYQSCSAIEEEEEEEVEEEEQQPEEEQEQEQEEQEQEQEECTVQIL